METVVVAAGTSTGIDVSYSILEHTSLSLIKAQVPRSITLQELIVGSC